VLVPRTATMDLRERENCRKAVAGADLVIHMAAKVGGIGFNRDNPATLFYENLIMGSQLMEEARVTLDTAKRLKNYQEAAQIWHDEAPELFLFQGELIDAVRNEVEINAIVAYLFANSETHEFAVKNPPRGDAKNVRAYPRRGCASPSLPISAPSPR